MPRHEGQRYVHTLVCQRLLERLQGGTVCRAVGRGKGGIGKAAGILRGIGKGVRSFKEGMNEAKEEAQKIKDEVEKDNN